MSWEIDIIVDGKEENDGGLKSHLLLHIQSENDTMTVYYIGIYK